MQPARLGAERVESVSGKTRPGRIEGEAMRKTLTIILLTLLVLLTGSGAQGPSTLAMPTLTTEEEAVVSMYAAEYMELRQIMVHLQGVIDLVQFQMEGIEAGLLEERNLDPERGRVDWATATIQRRDRGI